MFKMQICIKISFTNFPGNCPQKSGKSQASAASGELIRVSG